MKRENLKAATDAIGKLDRVEALHQEVIQMALKDDTCISMEFRNGSEQLYIPVAYNLKAKEFLRQMVDELELEMIHLKAEIEGL